MLNRISRHAPEWLRDLEEYIEIWKFYELVDNAEDQIEHNLSQFWVSLADEEGLTRWEVAFDLPHTGTIEERRQAILLLLQAKIPYTFRWLKNYLSIIWNDYKPHVVVHFNGDYIITFQPKQEINMEDFYEVMRKKIPANLAIEILPAPFVIDDTWLGEGVLDSAGIRLLSSGVYVSEMITNAVIGQGVFESEGDKIQSTKTDIPEMIFSDESYYFLTNTSWQSTSALEGAHRCGGGLYYRHEDGTKERLKQYEVSSNHEYPCIVSESWFKAYPNDDWWKLYVKDCKHDMMYVKTTGKIKEAYGDKVLFCPLCGLIFNK